MGCKEVANNQTIEWYVARLSVLEDCQRTLRRILNAHDSDNNGAFMGEAVICQAFATEARYNIARADGVTPEAINPWRVKRVPHE